jgi:hypothetical protein
VQSTTRYRKKPVTKSRGSRVRSGRITRSRRFESPHAGLNDHGYESMLSPASITSHPTGPSTPYQFFYEDPYPPNGESVCLDKRILSDPLMRPGYGMSPASSSLPALSSSSMDTPSPLPAFPAFVSECRTPETPAIVSKFEDDLRDPPLFMREDDLNPWEGHPYEDIFMNMTGSSDL